MEGGREGGKEGGREERNEGERQRERDRERANKLERDGVGMTTCMLHIHACCSGTGAMPLTIAPSIAIVFSSGLASSPTHRNMLS